MPRLDKWTLRRLNPFEPDFFLTGFVHNHPNFDNGTYVQTSRVVELDMNERRAVTKSGTVYELGEALIETDEGKCKDEQLA